MNQPLENADLCCNIIFCDVESYAVSTPRCQRGKSQHGFTLIELLVVISIIALLISILLPALKKTKELSRSIACRANLHTMGQAEVLHTLDYDGNLAYTKRDIPSVGTWYWAAFLWNATGRQIPNQGAGPVNIQPVTSGWLRCPSLKADAVPWVDMWEDVILTPERYLQNISYSRNGWALSKVLWWDGGSKSREVRMTEILNPSKAADIADGHYIFYTLDASLSDWNTGGLFSGTKELPLTRYRHGNGHELNLLLWDGHVVPVVDSIGDNYELNGLGL